MVSKVLLELLFNERFLKIKTLTK